MGWGGILMIVVGGGQKTSKLQAHFWAADLAAPMHGGHSWKFSDTNCHEHWHLKR